MASPFIVLEGMDGVGKTTIARLLAQRLNGAAIATPLTPFNQIRQEIEELKDLDGRFHYYLAAMVGARSVIRSMTITSPIVCDRYIWSTLAYHRALGVSTDHINIQHLPLIWPDHVFLLTAPDQIRYERLRKRGMGTWDERFLNQELQERLKEEYRQFGLVSVDTNTSPTEIVDVLHNLIIDK